VLDEIQGLYSLLESFSVASFSNNPTIFGDFAKVDTSFLLKG
jgi:hypothetical protein